MDDVDTLLLSLDGLVWITWAEGPYHSSSRFTFEYLFSVTVILHIIIGVLCGGVFARKTPVQSHIILNLRGDEPTKTCSLLHITYRTCEAIESAIDVSINTLNWQILGIPPWFRICVPCQVGRSSSFHGLLLKTAISRCRFCFTIMVYSSRTSNITTKAVSSCEIKPRRMGMSQKSSTLRQIISVPINNRQVENVCN